MEFYPPHGHYVDFGATIEGTSGGDLPHWFQRNKLQFVTFRLADALPASKLHRLKLARDKWMDEHPQPWDEETRREYHLTFSNTIEKWSDAGYGACILKNEALADIVVQVLEYHDGQRYQFVTYVVMSNHVHVLFFPFGNNTVRDIVGLWKSFSARAINKALQRTGRVWQREYYDTMIRNDRHRFKVVAYIGRNYAHGGVRFRAAPRSFIL